MKNPSKALIDGDAILCKAGFATEGQPVSHALQSAKSMLQHILKFLGIKEQTVFLADTEKTNFRYQVATLQGYKENRKGQKRPAHEKELREYMIKHWGAVVVSGAEVDDALGLHQTEDTIICSNDKDLDMIPGWHYDFDVGRKRKAKGNKISILKGYKKKSVYYVSDPGFLSLRRHSGKWTLVGAGYKWFCAQLLLGDSSDNIPGVHKCGPVQTYNVLRDCKTEKEMIQKCYKMHHFDKDRFCEIAQLLWIKRNGQEKIFPKEWLDECGMEI